jgi:anti-sigma regulatory factor (Ser/Thr protein kinase)
MTAAPPSLEVHLAAGATAPSRARTALVEIEDRVPAALVPTLRLLVSEVVTNSVRHAGLSPGDPVILRVQVLSDRVAVEVWDRGPGYLHPSPRRGDHRVGTGWGLYLVELLADRWGTEHGEQTRTWFELTWKEA